jgi:hypothetical protein
MDDDQFEPRLGMIRSPASRRGRRFLGRVLAASAVPARSRSRNRSVSCERIGRGAGIGRLLGNSPRFAALRFRRAIVKTRLV